MTLQLERSRLHANDRKRKNHPLEDFHVNTIDDRVMETEEDGEGADCDGQQANIVQEKSMFLKKLKASSNSHRYDSNKHNSGINNKHNASVASRKVSDGRGNFIVHFPNKSHFN